MKSCFFFLNFHSTYHDCDSEQLQCVSYFGDIFSSLSELNLSLQGTSVMVFSAYDENEAKLQMSSFGHLV